MARKSKAPEPVDEPVDDDSDDSIDSDPVADGGAVDDESTQQPVSADTEVDVETEATEPVAEAPAPFSLREFGVKAGLTGLEGVETDEEAAQKVFQHLANVERQRQQYQFQLQQYQQKVREWEQRQQQPAPKAEAPSRTVPEYDPRWLQMVEKDANGNLVAKPGAQPDLPQKLMAWVDWKEEQQQKLLTDPAGYIMPLIQEQVAKLVEERTQGSLSQVQTQAFVHQTIQQNADWLYERDAAGQTVIDPVTGGPQFSVYGQRYYQYAAQAEGMGIRDPRAQDTYARQLLRADLIASQRTTTADQNVAATTNQQLKKTALANGAARTPNRGGSIPRNPRAPAQNGRLEFAEALRADLEANGFDNNFRL